MESLVQNEQLPGTSPPPMTTSTNYVACGGPPPYSYPPLNPPQYAAPSHTSVIVVRDEECWEPAPPGVIAKGVISLTLSIIALFFGLPLFCAIPSIVFASMALARNYDGDQRQSYANTALGLMVASYGTIIVFVVVVVILALY